MGDAIPASVDQGVRRRAGNRCECVLAGCAHEGAPLRCKKALNAGQGEIHRTDRSRPHTESNCILLCVECHRNTPTYGKP